MLECFKAAKGSFGDTKLTCKTVNITTNRVTISRQPDTATTISVGVDVLVRNCCQARPAA